MKRNEDDRCHVCGVLLKYDSSLQYVDQDGRLCKQHFEQRLAMYLKDSAWSELL